MAFQLRYGSSECRRWFHSQWITANNNNFCVGSSTFTVNGGSLERRSMVWFEGSCFGTIIGNGTQINVTPTVSTMYYVRCGGIMVGTSCVSIASMFLI